MDPTETSPPEAEPPTKVIDGPAPKPSSSFTPPPPPPPNPPPPPAAVEATGVGVDAATGVSPALGIDTIDPGGALTLKDPSGFCVNVAGDPDLICGALGRAPARWRKFPITPPKPRFSCGVTKLTSSAFPVAPGALATGGATFLGEMMGVLSTTASPNDDGERSPDTCKGGVSGSPAAI